ncbi:hypothetical protein GCM10011348_21870 [Marinobacterium nitratireducens]|uniref:Enoyl-CoA hydratase n=1 Tax=Marinobacterium nitratireducens TaxID=518897 RepID=A0A918DT89_9GAMM|nr:enoyl-CoA hydratase/isomerase family protein [Marinobacterium nitratireducens]GGO81868.1 hypothetical protein GCM10011348_21870 [Marinobacterium nitratireducens]
MRALVSLELSGNIGVIRVDNPQGNMLSQPVRAGLLEAIELAGQTSEIGAVVLLCEGDTFISESNGPELDTLTQFSSLQSVVTAFERCDKPLICAVQGKASGIGLDIALACQYRIANRNTQIVLPWARAAVTRMAKCLCRPIDAGLVGRSICADDAQEFGILHLVVEEDAHTTALAIGQSLAVRLPAENKMRFP